MNVGHSHGNLAASNTCEWTITLSMSWKELPILPLCRIYEYLSIKDCLAASSCCQNWRYGFRFHRLERVQLCLKINNESLEKNIFLTEFYYRNVKDLKIILENCIDEYSSLIFKRFFNSKQLTYISYVPTFEYLSYEKNKYFLLRVLEPLLRLCELPSLQGINLNGCSELAAHFPTFLQSIRYRENFKSLGFAKLRPSLFFMPIHPNSFNDFVQLKYLSLDYEYMSEEFLMGIQKRLPSLNKLILHITKIPEWGFEDLSTSWIRLRNKDNLKFTVTINCILLPAVNLRDVNEKVLCEGLPLEKLRILFCKSIFMGILRKLVEYNETLKELVWIDSFNDNNFCVFNVPVVRYINQVTNPLVMMCWQCPLLEKITLHGYWHSADDLLGMARLRGNSLQTLDISALLPPSPVKDSKKPFTPVKLTYDIMSSKGPYLSNKFVQKMKNSLRFPWHCPKWRDLHPSLLDNCVDQKNDYIINIIQNDIPTMDEFSE